MSAIFSVCIAFFCLFWSGQSHALPELLVAEGKTMGTTYRVLYFDEPLRRDYSRSIDSLLIVVNNAINTYDPSSEISRFNKSKRGVRFESEYFKEILQYSKQVHRWSRGAFDPTVMPLVNAWGFGPEKGDTPEARQVDSLRTLVGFDKVRTTKRWARKRDARIQLDMGGIGQGYGADIICRFLKAKGIQHMLVEVGGEGAAFGRNIQKDRAWTIGVLDPNSTLENQFFKAYVTLVDKAFTTSGNYFNYKVVNGRKYGHTIDPSTGYPAQHSLLSASVFSAECTFADAWATAFMVMGANAAIEQVKSRADLDAILLYSDEHGEIQAYVSEGIRGQVILEQ